MIKECDLSQVISDGLRDFDERGNLKAFNPGTYLLQMLENKEELYNFEGLRGDLEAVVAETLMEAELRKISFETDIDSDGKLIWNAPGHNGGENGDVLEMADKTVRRYQKMSEDVNVNEKEREKLAVMTERFFLERQQIERIIELLSNQKGGSMVLAILPDNEVVYPLTKINYLTAYRLRNDEDGGTIIEAHPLMNRYSNRVLSKLLNGNKLSEKALILGVQQIEEYKEPEDLFSEIETWVDDEERRLNQVGSIVDRTKEVDECRAVIGFGRSYLEAVLNLEFENLIQGDEWDQVRERLDIAWELVVKNIVGFLSGEIGFLTESDLRDMLDKYIGEIKMGFSRARFLSEIIGERDLQALGQPLVMTGACGSLGFGGLGGVPIGANAVEWKPGACVNPGCAHSGAEVMVGPCGICGECEKVL